MAEKGPDEEAWQSMLLALASSPDTVLPLISDPRLLIDLGNGLLSFGDADVAILAFRKALAQKTFRRDAGEWAENAARLAQIWLDREDGKTAENIEEAISVCSEALDYLYPDELRHVLYVPNGTVTLTMGSGRPAPGRAALLHQLAHAYERRTVGDHENNSEVAIRAYHQAWVDTDARDRVNWAVEALNFGKCLGERTTGDRAANVEGALSAISQAVDAFTEAGHTRGWAAATMSLALTHLLVRGDGQKQSAATPLQLYEQVLWVRRREVDPIGWASTTLGMAGVHLRRGDDIGGDALGRAIALLEDVLSEPAIGADPNLHFEALDNLGIAYRTRVERAGNKPGRREIKIVEDAVRAIPDDAPWKVRLSTLISAGALYADAERWESAEKILAEAVEIDGRLLEIAVYEAGRRDEPSSGLHALHAYCLVKCGRYDEAVARLESGKARLLALALALTEARLETQDPALRKRILAARASIRELETAWQGQKSRNDGGITVADSVFVEALATRRADLTAMLTEARAQRGGISLHEMSTESILRCVPERGVLVAPVFTEKGSAIFVIPHGTNRVSVEHVLMLDDFTVDNLRTLVERFSVATKDSIEATGRALWDGFVGRVAHRIDELHASRAVLLPQSGLGLLPVHAAWHQTSGGRRYLADDVTISYAPSAYD